MKTKKALSEYIDLGFKVGQLRKKLKTIPSKDARKSGQSAYARILAQAPK